MCNVLMREDTKGGYMRVTRLYDHKYVGGELKGSSTHDKQVTRTPQPRPVLAGWFTLFYPNTDLSSLRLYYYLR